MSGAFHFCLPRFHSVNVKRRFAAFRMALRGWNFTASNACDKENCHWNNNCLFRVQNKSRWSDTFRSRFNVVHWLNILAKDNCFYLGLVQTFVLTKWSLKKWWEEKRWCRKFLHQKDERCPEDIRKNVKQIYLPMSLCRMEIFSIHSINLLQRKKSKQKKQQCFINGKFVIVILDDLKTKPIHFFISSDRNLKDNRILKKKIRASFNRDSSIDITPDDSDFNRWHSNISANILSIMLKYKHNITTFSIPSSASMTSKTISSTFQSILNKTDASVHPKLVIKSGKWRRTVYEMRNKIMLCRYNIHSDNIPAT